jgi:hypothetical protein
VTTVVRGSTPDLIAAAFYSLGFRPREALVVLALQPVGTRYRTGGPIARVDLPPAAGRAAVAARTARTLVRAGCVAAAVLVVTDRPAGGARAMAKATRTALSRCGIEVYDAIHVGDTTFRSVLCREPACCPPQGRPMAEVYASPSAAALVVDGALLRQSEADLIADVTRKPSTCDGPPDGDAEPDGREEPETGQGRNATAGVEDVFASWLAALEAHLEPGDVVADADPRWSGALTDVRFRDAVLASLCGDPVSTAWALLRGERPAIGLFLTGAPDTPVTRRGAELLAAVARRGTPEGRREALAILACLAWWRGRATRARLLVGECLALDPGHRLARLIEAALVEGVPPPWVPRPRAASAS